MTTTTMPTYADVSDEDVLRNYAAGCEAEVRYHALIGSVPPLVESATDAWMREGMRRGIL